MFFKLQGTKCENSCVFGAKLYWLIVAVIIVLVSILVMYYAHCRISILSNPTKLTLKCPAHCDPGEAILARVILYKFKTLKPIKGNAVTIYLRNMDNQILLKQSGQSNAAGSIVFKLETTGLKSGRYMVDAESESNGMSLNESHRIIVKKSISTVITTDKPIYKPGQTIHIRTLSRNRLSNIPVKGHDTNYAVLDSAGNTIFKRKAKTSEYGIASVTCQLANEIKNGAYWILAEVDKCVSRKMIMIKSYKLPKFDVRITFEKPFFNVNEEIVGEVKCHYFFGEPVANAKVDLRIKSSENMNVDKQSGTTDKNGVFRFRYKVRKQVYTTNTITVSAEAQSDDGFVKNAEARTQCSLYPLLLKVIQEDRYLLLNQVNRIHILTMYPDSSPASCELTIGNKKIKTSGSGVCVYNVTPKTTYPKPLCIQAKDAKGNSVKRFIKFDVTSAETDFILQTNASSYVENDLVELTVRTGFKSGAVFVDLMKGSQCLMMKQLNVCNNNGKLVFRLPENLTGLLQLKVSLGLGRTASVTKTKFLSVVSKEKLNIRVGHNKKSYRPGERAILTFFTHSNSETPIPTALSLSIVDKAVSSLYQNYAIMSPAGLRSFSTNSSSLMDGITQGTVKTQFELDGVDIPKSPYQLELSEDSATIDKVIKRCPIQWQADLRNLKLIQMEKINNNKESGQEFEDSDYEMLAPDFYYSYELNWLYNFRCSYVLFCIPFFILVAYHISAWITLLRLRGFVAKKVTTGLSQKVEKLDQWIFRSLCFPLLLSSSFALFLTTNWFIYMFNRTGGWSVPRVSLSYKVYQHIHSVGILLFIACVLFCLFRLVKVAKRVINDDDIETFPVIKKVTVFILASFAITLSLFYAACFIPTGFGVGEYIFFWHGKIFGFYFCHAFFIVSFMMIILTQSCLILTQLDVSTKCLRRKIIGRLILRLLVIFFILILYIFLMAIIDGNCGLASGGHRSAIEVSCREISIQCFEDIPEAPAPVKVRRYFPETLAWQPEIITDAHGHAEIDIKMADSITNWTVLVDGVTASGQTGCAKSELPVFQEFFIDVNTPDELINHDMITIPVTVYNYLACEQNVHIALKDADWFKVVKASPVEVAIPPNQTKTINFYIKVTKAGPHKMTVTAVGNRCSDAVEKEVCVMFAGQKTRISSSGFLGKVVKEDVTFPRAVIPESRRLYLKLFPGSFSQVVDGLEQIFRMPSGCFEQTSSITYPNVLVLNYLKKYNKVAPALEKKVRDYIFQGYQRLLSFEVVGGGFSLYGQAPADVRLTAYGLMEFQDIATTVGINSQLVNKTYNWLLEQQQQDGSWRVPFKHSFENKFVNTAYITWALLKTGIKNDKLDNAINYLEHHVDKIHSPYALGLCCNALIEAQRRKGDEILEQLIKIKKVGRNRVFWQVDGSGVFYSTGLALDIETTALIAYAMLRRQCHREIAFQALQWLVNQKDSYGTWHTTQSTIFVMKALLAGTVAVTDEAKKINIQIELNDNVIKNYLLMSDHCDMLHSIDLSQFISANEKTDLMKIQANIPSNLAYQIVAEYVLPWSHVPVDSGNTLTLTQRYNTTSLKVNELLRCHVTLSLDSGTGMMPIIELGLLPGCRINTNEFDKLVNQDVIKKYEINKSKIIIYLQKVEAEKPIHFTYTIKPIMPLNVQIPVARAYLYYNPAVNAWTKPVRMRAQ